MKRDVRFLGIDDGPFVRGDESTRLIGVATRGPGYVEGVLSSRIGVDGTDATKRIRMLLVRSRFRSMIRCVFFNGIFVGGLNVVDLDHLYERINIPLIAITRRAPRPDRVEAAIRKAFAEPEPVLERVARLSPKKVPGHRLWGVVRGVTMRDAGRIIESATVRGTIPEALRLAHVIASGVERGESIGRA